MIKLKTVKGVYTIYENENCYLIQGLSQSGNDFIIDNAVNILNDVDDINNMDYIYDKLMWIHANGPSPHFILYTKNKLEAKDVNNYALMLEMFVKSKCPKKSNLTQKLSCCMLKDVTKTKTPGLVQICSKKLSDLLN